MNYNTEATFDFDSKKMKLKSDEVLAIAFEYTYAGKTYQVGEFSTDKKEGDDALYVKFLKS